ncbi:MAG: bifunctional phosphoserine phosphatase/homoserine phosphotransferase ThrH [Candidatus Glassbacteria bacterium]|nr:bifunctional phosphoserine phosphatase/homoserine phosphotransferase ThrH [Candidatus Glassbacteria bacterium]
MPVVTCLDMEGVLTPEIWINVARKTGIGKLNLTTRDISDYDELMTMRLEILEENGLKLADIQDVIAGLDLLDGAGEFLDSLRRRCQVIVLSDTFYEFADPLIEKLNRPILFCNSLTVDSGGRITDYRLRQQDGKRKAIQALHGLNFKVIAVGDSYNDTSMLAEAEAGILFRPPQKVVDEFPQFPVTESYAQLRAEIDSALEWIES